MADNPLPISSLYFLIAVSGLCVILTYWLHARKARLSKEYQDLFLSLHNNDLTAIFSFDAEGRITQANAAGLSVFGYAFAEIENTDITDLFRSDAAFHSRLKDMVANPRQYAETSKRPVPAACTCKDGRVIYLDVSVVSRLHRGVHKGGFLLAQNVTEQKVSERWKHEQAQILETIVQGKCMNEIMHSIVSIIEKNHPNRICSILLVDEESNTLHTAAAPSLPEAYTAFINGSSIAADVGSCGRAACLGITVIVEDIASDPLWVGYREIALEHGLHSCWSTPIFSRSGKVVGTFAMYAGAVTSPELHHVESLEGYSRLVGMAIDHKRSEDKLRESEYRHQLIADNMSDFICLRDITGKVTYLSPSYQKFIKDQDFSWEALVHEEDSSFIKEHFHRSVRERKPLSLESRIWNIRENSYVWFETRINPIMNAEGEIEHVMLISRDVTTNKNYADSLEKMAYFDSLTGLPNRRFMTEQVAEQIKRVKDRKESFALLYLDCDRFKNLNESLGYEAGDYFLQMMGARLKECMLEQDTVARVGGDSFMLLLSGLHAEEEALQVADRLLNALRKPWEINGEVFYLTSSIGLVYYTGQSESEMMQQAEVAGYSVKRSGKNNFRIYQPFAERTASYNSFLLEKNLAGALGRGEFEVWYQAQVNNQTGEIVGAEALLRWNHPQWGLIYPGEFIQLAEDTGQIVEIGLWVLKSACLQMVEWQSKGLPRMHICVNISPRQLHEPGFISAVRRVLVQTGLDPGLLYLEITEGMLLRDDPGTLELLNQLCQTGLHLSVDDFGTGYSSLSYIKSYPIDLIKIDRSFIRDIPHDSDDIAIIKAIIDMSKSMEISVLAEGTESREQVECLRELGCEVVQGYLYAKPMNAEIFRHKYAEIADYARDMGKSTF